ncbi:MAG: helix-turn-helix domain-containing protein [Chitinophagaceae bacterium]|nr:helix-turn-helix domain-containing protein [Chitinophagaceae bacterium]
MNNKNFPDEYWDMFKERIIKLIEQQHRPASEVILDDVDIRNLLKISRRTALEYRRSNLLVYHKIENKIYYFLADVINFIKKAGRK